MVKPEKQYGLNTFDTLFNSLDIKFALSHVRANIYVIGGGALMMSGMDRVTKDLDCLVTVDDHSLDKVKEEILDIIDAQNLDRDFLHIEDSLFNIKDYRWEVYFNGEGIKVNYANMHDLLAMKFLSCRENDLDDILWLIKELNITNLDEIEDNYARVFRDYEFFDRAVELANRALSIIGSECTHNDLLWSK